MNDLVQAAKDVYGPLVVLAHPASGTQWTCWALRRAGLKGVQHEQISPSQQDPPWPGSVVVSYQYWPGDIVTVHKPKRKEREIEEEWTFWQMVRDPMRVVFSGAALCDKAPRILSRITETTIRDESVRQAALNSDPLIGVMISLVCHDQRASDVATQRFRVEDIAPPKPMSVMPSGEGAYRMTKDPAARVSESEKHRNSHVKTVPSWERLEEASRKATNWFGDLQRIAKRDGYL